MELTEQEKKCRNSTAKTFARLSIGVFTVSLVGDVHWVSIALIVFGVVLALSGIYLIVPFKLKQEWFLCKVADKRTMSILEAFGWFSILALFGLRLIQKGVIWLTIIGILFALLAYVVLYYSLWRAKRISEAKGGKTMGNKGRSNVKKPKQSKEKKPQAAPVAKKK